MLFFDDANPVCVTRGSNVKRFQPRWLYDDDCSLRILVPSVKEVGTLADFVVTRKPAWVLVQRGYAMGDILMLLPVLSAMHRTFQMTSRILLATRMEYLDQLDSVNKTEYPVAFVRSHGGDYDYGASVHVDLDGVLEGDHRGGAASNRHRMDLYADFLGVRLT